MSFNLDSKIPEGPIQDKWKKHKFHFSNDNKWICS